MEVARIDTSIVFAKQTFAVQAVRKEQEQAIRAFVEGNDVQYFSVFQPAMGSRSALLCYHSCTIA